MEAQRCAQLTNTNSPFALILDNKTSFFPINYIFLGFITPPNFFGGHRGEGTPDPIPNSEVKLSFADDTAVFIVGK